MLKRFATIKSRLWRAYHFRMLKHDAAWPSAGGAVVTDAGPIALGTNAGVVSVDLIAITPNARLNYVNANPVGSGVDVGPTALVTPSNATRAGTVTWVSPNLVFTPRAGYTGAVAFSATISNGMRHETVAVTGTVS